MAGQQHTILLVEDDAVTLTLLTRLFRERGWQVSAARTVSEGLKLLDPPPDFILLDLTLPDGLGETILRKVREERLPTRVAVCSGVSDPLRHGHIRELHPEAMFQKPIDFDDVFRVCEAEL